MTPPTKALQSIPSRRLIVVTAVAALWSCPQGGGPVILPRTPPTFVLAWNGTNGSISTTESTDGRNWAAPRVHATVSAGSHQFGPAISHDGGVGWMLMWVAGPELQFLTGVGGATATAGISWQSGPTSGLINALADSSPAIAYGAERWIAVYRSQNGQLRVVRSMPLRPSSWEAPVDVRIGSGGASRPVTTTHAAALAFGVVEGQGRFVLLYKTSTQEAQATTSPDGLTWSNPVTIGPEQKEPALSFANGVFYAALTQNLRGSGTLTGFETTIYKSLDFQTWREIGTILRTAQNIAGPGFAVEGCHFLMTEQIGGALGGAFGGISQRRADNLRGGCGCGGPGPGTLSFASDEPVRPGGGSANASVGHTFARTTLAFADTAPGTSNGVELDNVCITQSGLMEDSPPSAPLVSGKTTMLRAMIRSRAGGQAVPIDTARADVRSAADNSLIVSVPGFAFAADNTMLLPLIADGQDAHFFIPGTQLRPETDVRIDVVLTRGGNSFSFPAVTGDVPMRRHPGIPLVTVGYDLFPPNAAVISADLVEMARMYPVPDGAGTMNNTAAPDASVNRGGVRFVAAPPQPLQVAGPGVPFVNGFVLINRIQGNGQDASGQTCSATVPTGTFMGRIFAFNFTGPEEVDGVPGFSAAELANCQGDPSPLAMRYANMIAQFNATASQQKSLINATTPNDPAKFAVSVVTGGPAGQDRSGLVGQCPTGLGSGRLCWGVVGQNLPVIHHEVGHAFELDHNDGQPPPTGPVYHLLNRVRIPNPLVTMRGGVGTGINTSFLLAGEYSRIHAILRSGDYANLALLESPAPPISQPAAQAAGRQALLMSGTISAADAVQILRTRVIESPLTSRSTGDEYAAKLLNHDGKEIAVMPFSPDSWTDHPDVPATLRATQVPRDFFISMPFPKEASRLVIEKAGRRLAEIPISERAPVLNLDQQTLGQITQPATVTWQASDPDGDRLEYDVSIQYPDGTRRVLAAGLQARQFTIRPGSVPGGGGLILRIEATDGFNTTARTITGIVLPNSPPEIMIVHPANGSTVRTNGFVTLRAVATDAESGMLAGESVQWQSSREGKLGRGDAVQIQFKVEGEHVITAVATDGDGGTVRSEVTIHVTKD